MALGLRFYSAVFGVAGVSSAVAIPLALNSGSRLTPTFARGGYNLDIIPSIVRCQVRNTNTPQEVDYGNRESQDVCWEEKLENQSNSDTTREREYSNLFKATWNELKNNWQGQSFGIWTQQCSDKAPWVVLKESNNEYLGLCSDKDWKNTQFAKRVASVEGLNKKSTVWICDSECWNDSKEKSSNYDVLKEENSSKWREIRFKKKIIDQEEN